MKNSKQLEQFTFEGTHFEIGKQHGQALKQLIQESITFRSTEIKNRTGQSFSEIIAQVDEYLSYSEEHAPDLLEEVEGIAEGAGIPFREVFFLQVASDINYYDVKCSAIGVRAEVMERGSNIVAQNWDVSPQIEGKQVILRIKPKGKPNLIMFARPGVVGYIGMNSYGISHVANQLVSSYVDKKMPSYFIKRRLLEMRSLKECIDFILHTNPSSSGNYVICSKEAGHVANIEVTPYLSRVTGSWENWVIHTNHITSDVLKHSERNIEGYECSTLRYQRLISLFSTLKPKYSFEDIKSIFSDHENFPFSICRHQNGTSDQGAKTVASVILEANKGILHVCIGNPCEGEFVEYKLTD